MWEKFGSLFVSPPRKRKKFSFCSCKHLQDMVYYLRGDCGMKLFDKYFQPYAEYCSSF